MTSVLADALACVVGAVDLEKTDAGVLLHRTSSATRAQLADPGFDVVSATPSGVRIHTVTDAAWLELDLALTRAILVGQHVQDTFLDFTVDGAMQHPLALEPQTIARIDPLTWEIDLDPAGPATFRLELGEPGRHREVEILLPTSAHTRVLDVRAPKQASLVPVPRTTPLWVHHGSSISHCAEVERPSQAWPAIVAARAGVSLLNLGLAGQCQLDQGMARTIRDSGADAISLELGINVVGGDTMKDRTFVSALHGFLDTIRDGAPRTPIVVVSPIYCGEVESAPGPLPWGEDGRVHRTERPDSLSAGALSLVRVRELLAQHVALRRDRGDTQLRYVDGLTLLGADDAPDLPDNLHPNVAGYARMAERFLPVAFGAGGAFAALSEPRSSR